MISDLTKSLADNGIKYIPSLSLSAHSTFRTGGTAELGVFPKSIDELVFCLSEIQSRGLPFYVLGNGSNVLFLDGVLQGVFVFTKGLCGISTEGNVLTAEAGATLSSVATAAANSSLTGLEFAKGIPGCIGGALFMNAGAYGGQMSDVTVSSECYDVKSKKIFSVTDHGFGYRESIYEKNASLICLSAKMSLAEGKRDEIFKKMQEYAEKRRLSQPLEFPSAGSYFKRPEGHFAGKLIEDCGLKGLTVGGASVSEKHAGFIINRDGATAADILELEKRVIDAVLSKYGVKLEREVRVIG